MPKNARSLVEEFDNLDKDTQNKEEFEKKVISLIEEKFIPLYQELFQLVKTVKELYPDTNEYSFSPSLVRKIDEMTTASASLVDIINDKPLGKGNVAKIRKVLGYNG